MDRGELIGKAQSLRSQGLTFAEIRTRLGIEIPKTTLSYWCRNILLPKSYYRKLERFSRQHLAQARIKAVKRNQEKQERLLESLRLQAINSIKNLNSDDMKAALAMLYLGEGSKWQSYRGLKLGSSDPRVITIYIKLLKICYGIQINDLRLRIQYRADQNIDELQKYWSKVTGVHFRNFYRTIPDPRTRGIRTRKENYRGVCVVSCRGTRIQLELDLIADLLHQRLMGQ